jgi:hypothetical protein
VDSDHSINIYKCVQRLPNVETMDFIEERASTKIVFNGQEIDFNGVTDAVQTLSPALVKEKWRRQQILMQGISNGSGMSQCTFDGLEYLSSQDSSMDSFTSSSDLFELTEFQDECPQPQVLLWSGWLSKRSSSSFGSVLMRQWRKRWFVLALKQGRFSLEYYVEEDKQSCAMALRRTFLVDQEEPARRESASSRSTQAYLSVPIVGSKRRLLLASPSAAEADFLVASLNALRPTVASESTA